MKYLILLTLLLTSCTNFTHQNIKEPVIVLGYHDIRDKNEEYSVSPKMFDEQMKYLYTRGYKTTTFQDVFLNKHPKKSIIITFDDGYISFVETAVPIMRKYHFNSVLSIIGEYVGEEMPDVGENRQMASWDDYRKLGHNDIEYGSHTYGIHHPDTHGALNTTNEQLFFDLLKSKHDIERELGVKCEILTWPYGAYDEDNIKVAKAIGFKYLLTSDSGILDNFSAINRIHITHDMNMVEFEKIFK